LDARGVEVFADEGIRELAPVDLSRSVQPAG
jgi:hypothetical protein